MRKNAVEQNAAPAFYERKKIMGQVLEIEGRTIDEAIFAGLFDE